MAHITDSHDDEIALVRVFPNPPRQNAATPNTPSVKSPAAAHAAPMAPIPPFNETSAEVNELTNLAQSLSSEAGAAVIAERNMTFLGGCRHYPKAIFWCLLLSSAIIMEAYDKSLISSFYAFPAFRRAYGSPVQTGTSHDGAQYQISSSWQAGLTNSAVCGEIIGLFFNGYLTDRFGYRKTMAITLIWMCLSVFLAFFAADIRMLLVSQIVCGVPWGIIQVLAATYAADIMPVALRAYLLGNVNMCWVIGQLAGAGVLRGLVSRTSQWSYRIPFALQWAWAIPLVIGVFFAPESPWWLVRHDKPTEARRSLRRLATRHYIDLDRTISLMVYTNKAEKRLSSKAMTYTDCFKGSNLRRTEISCLVWLTQAMCGSTLTAYASYFYEQAGFNTSHAFSLSTGMYGMAIVGGIISWVLLRHGGRRKLYLCGLFMSLVLLLAGGMVSVTLRTNPTSAWVLGSLIIFMTFIYGMTIGPVCYVVVAEIPSTRLRVKTVVLARVTYNIAIMIANTLASLMLNPTAWNWKGKSCFPFAGTTLLCLVWCYFRLPETKGLAYLELDILFEKRAPAKKFKMFQSGLAKSGYLSILDIERSKTMWHGWQGYS